MSDDMIAQLRTKYCCAAWNEGCNCGDIADRIEAQAAEIERKALALFNEVARERGAIQESVLLDRAFVENEALCRAIEERKEFAQRVSEAVVSVAMRIATGVSARTALDELDQFIITKPDPLVEAWLEAFPGNHVDDARDECAKISDALAQRGLEIREKSDADTQV